MKEVFESLPEELNALQALKSELQDMVLNAAGKAAAKFAVKAGIKQAAGSAVPVAGNIVMGLWSAYDAAVAIGDVNEIRAVANQTLEQLDVLEKKFDDIKKLGDKLDNLDKLTDKQIQEAATEGQDALATLNDCTRARKCNLVPHTQNDRTRGVEPADNGGCCNGQTGHHLVSGAAMREACPNYKHETAPTVCAEGTSQHFGSHKRVHEKYAEATGAVTLGPDGKMSMTDTLNAAAKSHKEAFPLSRCSEACILAQLKGYFDDKCPDSRVYPGDKNGNPIKPGGGTQGI